MELSSSRSSSPIVTPAESSAASVPIDSALKHDILKSMVQIAVRQTRSYQGSFAGTYSASAFLVNKELGLFFTAAHAVQGPCEGYIISHNDERCDFKVKYKDPEHDYAILQCPAEDLEALDLVCLTLSPESAIIGSHVYLIGNDSGEKVNILRGTISRLDTMSPRHFDSNVELIQASAAGKGGCSGGPLLTLAGEAIGICVSGHNNAHLDWFFPLHCPVRVLDDIVHNRPVSRGTIHTVWRRLPFYECRQLGLSRADQAEIKTDKNGLLVNTVMIPETEASSCLKVNDILLSVNGNPVNDFSELEDIFDRSVGRKVQVGIIRFGQKLNFDLTVYDFADITPTRLLSDSGATFHNVPYRTAVCWKVPLRGMYVASANLHFPLGGDVCGHVIYSINNIPTPNVIEGEKVLSRIQDRERVFVRYKDPSRNTLKCTAHITIDRHWYQMALTIFNRKTGEWEYSSASGFQSRAPEIKQLVATDPESSPSKDYLVSDIKRRFVPVTWSAPYVCLDEDTDTAVYGYGFIICNGLVLVSKTTCIHDMCDITIDIDGREVRGQIVHMDYRQNWTLIQYDATNTSTQSLNTVELASESLKELDTVTFVGISESDNFHSTKATITSSFISEFSSARHHAEAIDVLQIDSEMAHLCLTGVILNEASQVAGFWLIMKNSVRYVLPTTGIAPAVHTILSGGTPRARGRFNFRFNILLSKDARVMGVGDEYIDQGLRANGAQHRFFGVKRTSTEVSKYIKHGDVVLSINGKTITKYADFDVLDDDTPNATAKLVIVRNREQMNIEMPLNITIAKTTKRVSCIFGLVFQKPHTDIEFVTQNWPSMLIVTCSAAGSPGQQSFVPYGNFITGVSGTPVYDIDSFLRAVKLLPDEKDFTIQSEDWNGREFVDIIRKTTRAFEPYEMIKEHGKWKKVPLVLDDW